MRENNMKLKILINIMVLLSIYGLCFISGIYFILKTTKTPENLSIGTHSVTFLGLEVQKVHVSPDGEGILFEFENNQIFYLLPFIIGLILFGIIILSAWVIKKWIHKKWI